MGYDLKQRVTSLKQEVEKDRSGQVSFAKSFFIALIAFWVLAALLAPEQSFTYNTSTSSNISDEGPSDNVLHRQLLKRLRNPTQEFGSGNETYNTEMAQHSEWLETLKLEISARKKWLSRAPFGFLLADFYLGYCDFVASNFLTQPIPPPKDQRIEPIVDFNHFWLKISRGITSSLLRLGFVTIGFWPIWLFCTIFGYIAARTLLLKRSSADLLGICDRNGTLFYSGFYGPLRPNDNSSGTDLSCPGLACPNMVSQKIALNHQLVKILKSYNAFNKTNLELVRVILANADFPSIVDPEQPAEEITAVNNSSTHRTQSFMITNAEGTIEQSALNNLLSGLEAHTWLTQVLSTKDKILDKQNYSTLTNILLSSLTAERRIALTSLSPQVIATAILAIEAGKCLVYARLENGFTKISRFPHLQSRAVLHSLIPYHSEYDGQTKQIIRQAILGSRRHGDFGRPFLPVNISIPSRALRDWLEIIYETPNNRQINAHIVELDAHIEEINFNWKNTLTIKLRENLARQNTPTGQEDLELWKGLIYKSVILMPLYYVVDIALGNFSKARLDRINELIELTQNERNSLSISARLPGFKRQAEEAQKSIKDLGKISQDIASTEVGAELINKWLIIRRMLTRHNWLSTRVGDDPVPSDSLIQAILITYDENEKAEVLGLDALVPIRQRRFKELFGPAWEKTYYADLINRQHEIEVFVDSQHFMGVLAKRIEQANNGMLRIQEEKANIAASN